MLVRGWSGVVVLSWIVASSTVGCGSDESNAAAASDAGQDVASDDAHASGFGASACWGCVTEACSTSLQVCGASPSCAQSLRCLEECPVNAAGGVDAACAGECAAPSDQEGVAAYEAFDDSVELTT